MSSSLFSLARSKLHVSVGDGGRDNRSLYRWVLLKNSVLTSIVDSAQPFTPPPSPVEPDARPIDGEDDSEGFMFPDAGQVLHNSAAHTRASEAEWLDTLLQSLGDDDDDDDYALDSSATPSEDEDDSSLLYSPLNSPMSSSDDLASSSAFFQPHPYPIVYPPYRPPPPMAMWDTDALPYYDADDIEEPPVPEAIEDTSDDESDAPATPSLGRSNEAFPGLTGVVDPASIPLPPDRSGLRHVVPRVYIHDTTFNHFDPEPLPFARDLHPYYNTGC